MAAKKKPRKKAKASSVQTVDPRAPLDPTPKNLTATLEALRVVLAALPPPPADGAEPPPDPVDALLHFIFAEGRPCAVGQEALRRINATFVDRNEFRVTEAYETAELLQDLEIPDLFDRCCAARNSVGEIYNDQNDVSLDLLREATVAERNSFFGRVPAIPPGATRYLVNRLSFEELLFSDRSTLRVQQRLGLDAGNAAVAQFVDGARGLLEPYGHLPIAVLADTGGPAAAAAGELCPSCLLGRHGRKK